MAKIALQFGSRKEAVEAITAMINAFKADPKATEIVIDGAVAVTEDITVTNDVSLGHGKGTKVHQEIRTSKGGTVIGVVQQVGTVSDDTTIIGMKL